MCHFIQSRFEKNYYGFALKGFLFLGAKKLKIEDGKLKSYYKENHYYHTKIDEDGIYIIDEIKKQNIIFDIPILDPDTQKFGNYPLIKVIDAGLHVSPLVEIECLPFLDFWTEGIALPVAFLVDDIVFFDGGDISVKSFTILNPNTLKETFSETLKKIRFNWNLYEEIFDKLIKMLNGFKIEFFKKQEL